MMNIFHSLAAEIQKLRDSPHVEVLAEKSKLTDQQDLSDTRSAFELLIKVTLPTAVAETAWIDDDLHVYWKTSNHGKDQQTFGEFHLRSALMFTPRNGLNEVFLAKTYDGIDLRAMRVFDYYPYNGGPIHALLRVKDKQLEDGVYIFNERDVFRTSLLYQQYIGVLRVTRGFLYWQYLFCENPKLEEYEVAAIERGLSFVEREFPDDDYSDLRRRQRSLIKDKLSD